MENIKLQHIGKLMRKIEDLLKEEECGFFSFIVNTEDEENANMDSVIYGRKDLLIDGIIECLESPQYRDLFITALLMSKSRAHIELMLLSQQNTKQN